MNDSAEPSLPLLPLEVAGAPAALRRALAQEGVPHVDHDPARPQGRFVLHHARHGRLPTPCAGQTLLDLRRLTSDSDDLDWSLLDNTEALRHYWKVGGFVVSEEVARVDKRRIRGELLNRLRTRLEDAGGVWLRVAPWPAPYRTVFSMRLDYDEPENHDVHACLDAIAGREAAFTHFICGSAFGRMTDVLDRLRGHDVGAHGYWHHTYRDTRSNVRNIRRGFEVLRAARLEPHGFVAPHGRHPPALGRALAELRVPYSSEFGLVYDDWPVEIDGGASGGSRLQIPVHPICLGIMLDAAEAHGPDNAVAQRTAADATLAHFRQVARVRHKLREPIVLYGHPDRRLGRFPHVIRGLLQTVAGLDGVWFAGFREIAAWWRARSTTRLRVNGTPHDFTIHVDAAPGAWPVAAEVRRGPAWGAVRLDAKAIRVTADSLPLEVRSAPPLPQPLRVERGGGLKSDLLRLLDWEKVTPVAEIDASSVRGWLKRTLRRWSA